MPNGGVLQPDLQVVCANQACRHVPDESRGDVKLGRSPGWNLVRAERSRLCIFAYVENKAEGEINTCHVDFLLPPQLPVLGRSTSIRDLDLLWN